MKENITVLHFSLQKALNTYRKRRNSSIGNQNTETKFVDHFEIRHDHHLLCKLSFIASIYLFQLQNSTYLQNNQCAHNVT